MKIYGVSDIHSTAKENFQYIKDNITHEKFSNDVILIAGDISQYLDVLHNTLSIFSRSFRYTFFIPGNHDLYAQRQEDGSRMSSFDKLRKIKEVCKYLGVKMAPKVIDKKVLILPLYSWYNSSFDKDPTSEEEWKGLESRWMDFHLCEWPKYFSQRYYQNGLSEYFLNENLKELRKFKKKNGEKKYEHVISFSHFLPRRDLLPPKSGLKFKALPKVCGCWELDQQLRDMKSNLHLFGHSHVDCVRSIDNVIYIQNALGSPKDRKSWKKIALTNPFQPFIVYDSENTSSKLNPQGPLTFIPWEY